MNKNLKMILEIIIIAIALGFLEYQLLIKHENIVPVVLAILVIIVSIELIIKLIKDISLKKDNTLKKVLRVLLLIICILIVFSFAYPLVINKNGNVVLSYIATIGTGILVGYLFVMAIYKIVDIKKENGKQYINVKEALFNTVFFILILISVLIEMY